MVGTAPVMFRYNSELAVPVIMKSTNAEIEFPAGITLKKTSNNGDYQANLSTVIEQSPTYANELGSSVVSVLTVGNTDGITFTNGVATIRMPAPGMHEGDPFNIYSSTD